MQGKIALAGLAVGFLVGLTGVGGGAILTPLLIFLGVPPVAAVGSDLLYGTVTKLVGCYQHLRQGSVSYAWVWRLAIGSIPGAVLGSVAVHYLDQRYGSADHLVRQAVGGVLILAAVATVLHELALLLKLRRPAAPTGPRTWLVALFGFVIGVLVGGTSVGSGSLVAVVLMACSGLESRQVVGTDIAQAVLLIGSAGIAHLTLGGVDWALVANLLLGSLPGVLLGSRLAYVTPNRTLKLGLATLILLTGLKLI